MLRVEEFENLRGKVVGSDDIFLGSFFLSERTDKGVKLAALRASMAYSLSGISNNKFRSLNYHKKQRLAKFVCL